MVIKFLFQNLFTGHQSNIFLFSVIFSKPIYTAICKIKRYLALKTINFHIIPGQNQGVNFFFQFCQFVIFVTSSYILKRKRNTEIQKIWGKSNKVSSNKSTTFEITHRKTFLRYQNVI